MCVCVCVCVFFFKCHELLMSLPRLLTLFNLALSIAFSQLESPENYRILSGSGCTTLEGVDDATQFEEVQAACRTIGMAEETQLQVGGVIWFL